MRWSKLLLPCLLLGFFVWACGSDSSDEREKLANLGQGCSINSDCANPLVCAFGRCHVECENSARDCTPPALCVKWEDGRGVCQLEDEIQCSSTGPSCRGKQVCSAQGTCRDFCSTQPDCLAQQICVGTFCEDATGGAGGASGSGGAAGTGATSGSGGGGTGGTAGSGGSAGSGGAAGAGGSAGTGGAAGAGGTSGSGGAGGASGSGGTGGGSGGVSGSGGTGGTSTLPKPVAYWPMDSIGGAMVDSVGDLDGAFANSLKSDANGKVGTAIEFNVSGTSQHAIVASETTLNSPTAVAVAAWIKPAILLNASAGTRIIANRLGTFLLQYDKGNLKFQVTPGGGAPTTLSAAATFNIGTWYHVVGSYDVGNGNMMRLFIDKVEVASQTGPGSIAISSKPLYVGQLNATQGSFVGSIDELSFFKQGLVQADVDALFAAGNAPQTVTACAACAKPVAHWALDDNPDPMVPDASGANHGVNESGSVPATGKVGGGLRFVDAADHVRIPNTVSLNPSAALSIALWAQPSGILSGGAPSIVPFFDKQGSGTGYSLVAGASQGFRAVMGDKNAKATGITFSAGTWHHLVGTWDGANINLYIDGAPAASAAKSTPLLAYTGGADIGGTGNTLSGSLLGVVDEVVLYDVALSSAQVTELFNLGNAGIALPK